MISISAIRGVTCTTVGATIALFLAGCAGQPRVVTRPVDVVRTVYVPLDPGLLPAIDAPASATGIRTNGDLLRAWSHDAAALATCRAAMDGIRAVQPQH